MYDPGLNPVIFIVSVYCTHTFDTYSSHFHSHQKAFKALPYLLSIVGHLKYFRFLPKKCLCGVCMFVSNIK